MCTLKTVWGEKSLWDTFSSQALIISLFDSDGRDADRKHREKEGQEMQQRSPAGIKQGMLQLHGMCHP